MQGSRLLDHTCIFQETNFVMFLVSASSAACRGTEETAGHDGHGQHADQRTDQLGDPASKGKTAQKVLNNILLNLVQNYAKQMMLDAAL